MDFIHIFRGGLVCIHLVGDEHPYCDACIDDRSECACNAESQRRRPYMEVVDGMRDQIPAATKKLSKENAEDKARCRVPCAAQRYGKKHPGSLTQ